VAETIPLFPLCTVLLPGVSLPLHIFEPRYRQLTTDLVTGAVPGRQFGVVAIRQGASGEIDDVGQLHVIGCTAGLEEVRRLPDGRFNVKTSGGERFRLVDVDASAAPYLLGTIEWVPDEPPMGDMAGALPLLSAAARAAHRRYRAVAWKREDWIRLAEDTAPAALSNMLAADCLLSLEDRQRILEETCPGRRLNLVRGLLNQEAGILAHLHAVPTPLSEYGAQTSRN